MSMPIPENTHVYVVFASVGSLPSVNWTALANTVSACLPHGLCDLEDKYNSMFHLPRLLPESHRRRMKIKSWRNFEGSCQDGESGELC